MRVNSISPKVAQVVLFIPKRYKLNIVQVYAPTTSYSEEDINSFHNDVCEILGKINHQTILMGDCNAEIGKGINHVKMATAKFELELRNEKCDILV